MKRMKLPNSMKADCVGDYYNITNYHGELSFTFYAFTIIKNNKFIINIFFNELTDEL